jgi:hypothetical protein
MHHKLIIAHYHRAAIIAAAPSGMDAILAMLHASHASGYIISVAAVFTAAFYAHEAKKQAREHTNKAA